MDYAEIFTIRNTVDELIEEGLVKRWSVSEVIGTMLPKLPAGTRVVVLFSGALRLYDPQSGAWRDLRTPANSRIGPFTGMSARAPDFWISAESGLGRLRVADSGEEWFEIPGAGGLEGFRFPVPGQDGELLAQARAGAGRMAVVRWWRGKLEKLYTSAGAAPRGWRGPDGSLWVLEGSSLSRIVDGRKAPVERDSVLTGNVSDVYSEDGHTFWMGTSEGLVRYTPLLWQAPPGLTGFDRPVHAVLEDRRGRLWFAATREESSTR